MEMELSCAVTEGLQVAGSASLDEKVFRQLFMHALKSIIDTEAIQDEENNTATFKEALFGLSTLLIELARLDSDETSISSVLEECKFSPERAQYFTTQYLENKDTLCASLARVGRSPPHIVDVQWRLDYYLKSNHVERVSRPEYLINFSVQSSDKHTGVQFACTQEQLQDLVLKLKDATKTLDKYV